MIVRFLQIDSSTIDGNVEFVQLYSDVASVNLVFASDKIINYSDNFRIQCSSYSKISAISCVFSFLFLHFDTCDVVYNWPISLLQSIVLDNLFGFLDFWKCSKSSKHCRLVQHKNWESYDSFKLQKKAQKCIVKNGNIFNKITIIETRRISEKNLFLSFVSIVLKIT